MSNILEKFLDSLGVIQNLDKNTQKILPMLPPGVKEKIAKMLDGCREDVKKAYAKAYEEIFTQQEMAELTVIHDTPVMKKFKDKQDEILDRVDHYTRLIVMKYVAEQALKEPEQTPFSPNNSNRNLN